MFLDEEEPIKKKPALKNLDVMSVEQLQEYIDTLGAEIERAKAMIKSKQAAKMAADGFFKKGE